MGPQVLIAAAMLVSTFLPADCSPMARACPFCLAPPQTWAEILDDSEIVVVAELIDVQTFDLENRAVSRFRVTHVHNCPGGRRRAGTLRSGAVIVRPEYVEGEPGQTYLLTGRVRVPDLGPVATYSDDVSDGDPFRIVSQTEVQSDDSAGRTGPSTLPYLMPEFVDWDFPEPMSSVAIDYVLNGPSNTLPQRLRLPYYIGFLEHQNSTIAIDAWGEFARSEYSDVKAVRDQLPLTNLRRWIANSETFPERLGLYGMMLGLCGNENDAEFLLRQIDPQEDTKFRFGTEGLIGGYLLLTGRAGLQYLDHHRLRSSDASLDQLVATVFAMRFIWSYEPKLISRDELRRSLRQCLYQDDLQEMIIPDLARWQDWDAAFHLVELYDASGDDRDGLRRAIREFMRHCAEQAEGEALLMAECFLADTSAAEQRDSLRQDNELGQPR